jgi:hypothetical protein
LLVRFDLQENILNKFQIDAVAAAMYTIGFAETVRDLLKVRKILKKKKKKKIFFSSIKFFSRNVE